MVWREKKSGWEGKSWNLDGSSNNKIISGERRPEPTALGVVSTCRYLQKWEQGGVTLAGLTVRSFMGGWDGMGWDG